MANVHTLGDLNRNSDEPQGYGRLGGQQNPMGVEHMDEETKQGMSMFSGLTGGAGASAGKHPRKENYWDMWKTTFCPKFTPVSFTFLIWLINTGVYLATLIMMVSPNKVLNKWSFLGPDCSTLHAWGALDAYEIHDNYQVWRLFTSLLLSYGFTTYCIGSGALLIIGFMVENPKMSPSKMALLYFGSGILGNLFSVCIENEPSVGPMPAIMGLVAGQLGMIIVNWKVLHQIGMVRICLIFMNVMIFVIMLLLS